MGFDFGFTAI